ncbi:MAG: hypothetical protein ABIR91_02770 [Candidatus Saccharimonadales bacterium]
MSKKKQIKAVKDQINALIDVARNHEYSTKRRNEANAVFVDLVESRLAQIVSTAKKDYMHRGERKSLPRRKVLTHLQHLLTAAEAVYGDENKQMITGYGGGARFIPNPFPAE